MENLSKQLEQIVNEVEPLLKNISSDEWNYRRAPGKWSRKEILGHLIDSASNNHQRFVRMQFEDKPTITYDQNCWVSTQNYDGEPVDNLINLWVSFNRHLAHIIAAIPQDKYGNLCDIKKEQPVTLEWIIADYIRHLKHHLSQVVEK